MSQPERSRPVTTPSEDRVADPEVESLIDETDPTAVPDEERVVPDDVNDLVIDDEPV